MARLTPWCGIFKFHVMWKYVWVLTWFLRFGVLLLMRVAHACNVSRTLILSLLILFVHRRHSFKLTKETVCLRFFKLCQSFPSGTMSVFDKWMKKVEMISNSRIFFCFFLTTTITKTCLLQSNFELSTQICERTPGFLVG